MSDLSGIHMSDFADGWSAVAVNGIWIILEPTTSDGAPRPVELGTALWCIVTSDNPKGCTRGEPENMSTRAHLWTFAREVAVDVLETCGGVGSVGDPTRWPAGESGVAIPIVDLLEAQKLCSMFDQTAVYVLDGDKRLLVDREGRILHAQGYLVHRVRQNRPQLEDGLHTMDCICMATKYDESPFSKWRCVWGEVWGGADVSGSTPEPVRVFYGAHEDGDAVLLRSDPEAVVMRLGTGMSREEARRYALDEVRVWARSIEDSALNTNR